MPSTSTISVYVSTFLITESRRASGSGTRRQPSSTRQASARIRIHAIFCALPITKIVCVCACACVCTCACLRLFSLRYVFYSAPRRLNDLHSPSPPRSLPRTKIPSTLPLPVFSGTLKSRHFSP